ncbi:NUDIX hydrolase [bacterium]|nr:MAG: NUDIX hydrolase [bacterium]
MPKNNIQGIAAGIVIRRKKILLIKRRKPEGILTWQFPAGKIEANESPKNAAVREVREETGIRCKIVKKLGSRLHPNTNVEIYYWLCKQTAKCQRVRNSEEVETLKWCSYHELRSIITSDLFEPVDKYLKKVVKV